MVEFKGEDEESRCRGKLQRAGDGGIPARVKGTENHFRAAFPKDARSEAGKSPGRRRTADPIGNDVRPALREHICQYAGGTAEQDIIRASVLHGREPVLFFRVPHFSRRKERHVQESSC